MASKAAKNEEHKNIVKGLYNLSKVVADKPDSFTIDDACTSVGANATSVVAPMKKVNQTAKSTPTNVVMEKSTGKDTTKMSKNLLTLATAAKQGNVTVSDVSNAVASVEDVVKPDDVKPNDDSKGKNIGIIVGCSIAGVVLVAIIITTAVLCVRKNKSKKGEDLESFNKLL